MTQQIAKNPTHADYLLLKPIMQEFFPELFIKPVPLVRTFKWPDYLYSVLTKKKVEADDRPISRQQVGRFFRCWTHRKEYFFAIALSSHRVDEAGYPIERINNEEQAWGLRRYQTIVQKQDVNLNEVN